MSDATVSMFESSDGKYLKLIISHKTTEGTIESVTENVGNSTKVTINGKEYKLSKEIDTEGLYVGKNAFIYLDFNNKISYIKKDFSYGYMAYIIRVILEENEEEIKMKAFNQDGEVKVYDTAKKFSVDNKRYEMVNADTFAGIVSSAEDQLVMLEFDAEGKIRSVDTPQGEGELEISAPFENCNYRGVSPKIGKLTCIDSSTKIFSIPENPKNAQDFDFAVKAKGELGDWRTFNAQSYQYTSETDYADAVLIQGFRWNAPTDLSSLFIYKKSIKAVNDNDEVVNVLVGMVGADEEEYYCEEGYTPSDLSVGSAVFLDMNENGEVCGFEPVFDKDSEGGESNTNLVASRRIVIGYVNRVNGNVISIGYTDPSIIDEKFDITGTSIIVIDESKGADCVSAGNVADIISYEDSDSDYSKIAVHTHQMSQKVMVVYK